VCCSAAPLNDERCRPKAAGISDEEEMGRCQKGWQQEIGITKSRFAAGFQWQI
jgi:hypothetical protein